jgi:tetratricopeptide (TPR) repeat protein
MNKWWKYIPAYIPPLAIVVFLLVTNLFTRAEIFRNFLFPEKTISISAAASDDPQANLSPVLDSASMSDVDSLACNDSLNLAARAAYARGSYEIAIQSWTASLSSTACNASMVLNSIGIAQMKIGAIRDALASFSHAIQSDSTNERSWLCRGICWSRMNRPLDARSDYLKAVAIMPTLGKAYFNLGILGMHQKHFGESRDYFRKALLGGGEKFACWYNIGLTYQREDSLEQALPAYRECIRINPGQTAARLRMVEIWLDTKQLDSAKVRAQEAGRIDPGNTEVLLRLARIASAAKLFDQALSYLADIDKKHSGISETEFERARVYGLKGDDQHALSIYQRIMAHDPANPRVYYNIGVNLMDLGKDKQAVDAYERSLKADPSYWKAAYNLGVYCLRKNRPADAIPYFQRVVQVMPDRSEPLYNLGLAFLKAGNLDEAKKAFGHSIRIDSTHVESRYNLGLTFLKDGENDSAETALQSVLRLKRNHSKTIFNLGLIYRKREQFARADSFFANAIACKKSNYSTAWYNRALCQRSMGAFSNALSSIRNALVETDSEGVSAKAVLLEAELFDTLGMADSARAALSRADSLTNDDLDALKELANFCLKRNDLARVRQVYRRILRSDSLNAAILLSAANIEKASGSPDSAEALYKKAIASDEKNVDAITQYGDLLVRRKRYDDAIRVAQNAVLLEPGIPAPRVQLAIAYAGGQQQDEYAREAAKLKRIAASAPEMLATGKALYRAGKYSDALWFFEQMQNDEHTDRDEMHDPDQRYYVLLCRDKLQESGYSSERSWTKFAANFPKDHRGYLKLAEIAMQKKEWADARSYFEKTLMLKNVEDAHYDLAKVCLELGDRRRSREQIDIFLRQNPEDRKGKELYAAINSK